MDALAIIMRLGQGHLLEKLVDALNRTADEVVKTGQAGKVTLTLKVEPLGDIGSLMVGITEQIGIAAPKRKAKGSILYAHDGALHEDDPRQVPMDFRVIETAPAVVREA